MALIVYRGGRKLAEKEFRAHVAVASKLENLGVFLGAGASVGPGGLIMSALWANFRARFPGSVQWLFDKQFVTDRQRDGLDTANVEKLLTAIVAAEQEWVRQNPRSRRAGQLRAHRDNLYRTVVRAAKLDATTWDPALPLLDCAVLSQHRSLLAKLTGNRQPGQSAPWIFTTNYDLSVELAAEALGLQVLNGFVGLHAREFAPSNFDLGFRNINARGEARFGIFNCYLVKLHGSISWITEVGGSVHETPRKFLGSTVDTFLDKATSTWPGFVVYPSSAKYVDTTAFIYGEMIRRLTEFLNREQTCLFVSGYAFGDEHLNRVMLSALQNPTLHLIVYWPELREIGDPVAMDVGPNRWLRGLSALQLGQVTFVGQGADAHFDRLVDHLPVPALLDDSSQHAKRILAALDRAAASGAAV